MAYTYLGGAISGEFDQQDLDEVYSPVDATEQKFNDFDERCVNSPSEPYLKHPGTSSIRDLVSLGNAVVGKDQPIDY